MNTTSQRTDYRYATLGDIGTLIKSSGKLALAVATLSTERLHAVSEEIEAVHAGIVARENLAHGK